MQQPSKSKTHRRFPRKIPLSTHRFLSVAGWLQIAWPSGNNDEWNNKPDHFPSFSEKKEERCVVDIETYSRRDATWYCPSRMQYMQQNVFIAVCSEATVWGRQVLFSRRGKKRAQVSLTHLRIIQRVFLQTGNGSSDITKQKGDQKR